MIKYSVMQQHIPKLYLETTIINFVVAHDAPEKRAITERLLAEIKKGMYEPYISELTIDEINATSSRRRKEELKSVIEDLQPEILSMTEEVEFLAEEYIKAKIIPKSYEDDALHIAIATIYNMNAIVSWNFQHIVKLKTKQGVVGLNGMKGYKNIEICSPLEVIEDV